MSSVAKVWTKPLSGNRAAVLVINMAAHGATADVELDLSAIAPQLGCLKAAGSAGSVAGACQASDVWTNKTAGAAAGAKFSVTALASHDSAFYIFG